MCSRIVKVAIIQRHHLLRLSLLAITLLVAFAVVTLNITPPKQVATVPTLAVLAPETTSNNLHASTLPNGIATLPTTSLSVTIAAEPSSTSTNTTTSVPTDTLMQIALSTTAVGATAPQTAIPASPSIDIVPATQSGSFNSATVAAPPLPLIPRPPPPSPVPNTQIVTLVENTTENQRQAFIQQIQAQGGKSFKRLTGSTPLSSPSPRMCCWMQ